MKTSILLLGLLFGIRTFAVAPEILDQNFGKKEIQAILGYQLVSTLNPIEVDDDFAAVLEIKYQFDSQLAVDQANELRIKYPRFSVKRITPTEAAENAFVKVDSLGLIINPHFLQSMDGPYFIEQIYLNKQQYLAIKNSTATIQLIGKWNVQFAKTKTLDHFELPRSICKSLVRNGNELEKVLYVAYLFVFSPEMQKAINDPSTNPLAVSSIVTTCFDADSIQRGSVTEFLKQPLQMRKDDFTPLLILNEMSSNEKMARDFSASTTLSRLQ
jgi:hypothetical protein